MAKCISDAESKAYVAYMIKKKISLLDPPTWLQAWTKYTSLSSRQQASLATTIVNGFLEQLGGTPFPRFYFLNLIVTKSSDKHTMVLCLDYKDDRYTLELFDSNGTLFPKNTEWDAFVVSLVTGSTFEKRTDPKPLPNVLSELRERLDPELVDFKEVRYDKESINRIGTGNCDAMAFYYVAIRSEVGRNSSSIDEIINDTNDAIDTHPMDMARTTFINKLIQQKKALV